MTAGHGKLATAGIAAWLGLLAPASAADLPRERIVFTTRRPVNWQLYLLARDRAPRRLTDDPALNYDPAFAPNGRWIVFCSERSGSPQLWALDARKGGRPAQVTKGPFFHAAPAFTPDGRELLFVSDRDGNADVFRMPFHPGTPAPDDKAVNLTRHGAGDFRPAASPDGARIAFTSDRDFAKEPPFKSEIYVMERDGSDPRRLTHANAESGSPAWSADGKSIYFYSDRDGGEFRIWVMNSDGTGQRPLTPKGLQALSPAVLPHGRIAFAAKEGDGSRIMSVAVDGSALRPESGTQECRAPASDRAGRIVCAGRGPEAPAPFVDPGTRGEIQLPDRILEVQGVHAFSCSIGPEGREIVTGRFFTPGESGDMHLVASRPDGSGERELFRPPTKAWVWVTSWARQADLLAFTVGTIFQEDAGLDIWTIHGDGTGARNLTGGRFHRSAFPDLTADGSRIVFRGEHEGSRSVYTMGADGTEVRRLTPGDGVQSMPAISPAGDLLVYATFRLILLPLRGGLPAGPTRVLEPFSPSVHPRFSPDGKWVAYASRRAWLSDEGALSSGESQPYGEIFVAPVDGTREPIRLTHDRWEDSLPCWGPTAPP